MDLFAAAGALALGMRLLGHRRRAQFASSEKKDDIESIGFLQQVETRQLDGMTVVVTGGASGTKIVYTQLSEQHPMSSISVCMSPIYANRAI